MQIFWVSGAVGKIHRINLTLKHLFLGAFSFAFLLILLGVFLQFMGFQMAIEYNPQLARKLGNVHTAVELERSIREGIDPMGGDQSPVRR